MARESFIEWKPNDKTHQAPQGRVALLKQIAEQQPALF